MISSQLSWVSLPVFCLQLSVDVAPEASSNRDQIIHVSGTNCIRNWFICLASTMELKLLACSIPSEIFIQWAAFSVHLCLFFRSLRSRMRANRRLWGSIIRNRGLYWTESVHCSSSSVRYTHARMHAHTNLQRCLVLAFEIFDPMQRRYKRHLKRLFCFFI